MIRFDTKNLWCIRREDLRPLANSGGTLTEDHRGHNVSFTMGKVSVDTILEAARAPQALTAKAA